MDMNVMIGLGQGHQITDEKGASRRLSWIRPQMMQQVLSSIALSHQKRAAHFPSQMELLNLFPESNETIASEYTPLADGVTESRSVSSEKQSTAQLLIFYDGAVKMYDISADKAQAVMKFASSNSSSEREALKPSQGENEESKKVRKDIPMARKLSLQRFLQKRNDRVRSVTPYASTDNNERSKVWVEEKEDEEVQIGLSLSFPSQRSR